MQIIITIISWQHRKGRGNHWANTLKLLGVKAHTKSFHSEFRYTQHRALALHLYFELVLLWLMICSTASSQLPPLLGNWKLAWYLKKHQLMANSFPNNHWGWLNERHTFQRNQKMISDDHTFMNYLQCTHILHLSQIIEILKTCLTFELIHSALDINFGQCL